MYESIVENELSDGEDQHILKDELIYLAGQAADTGMDKVKLRWVAIYKEGVFYKKESQGYTFAMTVPKDF